MARERSNKSRGVQFTHDSAKQIADVVRQFGDTGRGQSGMPIGGNAQASPHYLSKTTAAWSKGTSQTLTIYVGSGGSESAIGGVTVTAWNKFTNIKANKWVMIARCNATFYVISAEC